VLHVKGYKGHEDGLQPETLPDGKLHGQLRPYAVQGLLRITSNGTPLEMRTCCELITKIVKYTEDIDQTGSSSLLEETHRNS
jgi:hypothetical protein